MVEVVVHVKLTNAGDQSAVRAGYLPSDKVRSVQVEASVDTGSVTCVLPSHVADTLGLARVFRQVATFADGRAEEVDVTEPVLLELAGRLSFEQCLVLGTEVLIGQTALEFTDLHVDCRNRRLIPNPAHPYQPVLKVR